MLSNTSNFAIRALIYLELYSSPEKKMGTKQMVADLDIPTPFLSKILQLLVKSKLLDSTKGPNGGFSLGLDAKDIHLMDIIDIIEGRDSFEKCAIGVKYCREQENKCAVHKQYSKLREEMKQMFSASNIYDLAQQIEQNKTSLFI